MNDGRENLCGFCFNGTSALRNLFVHETRKSFAVLHCLFTFTQHGVLMDIKFLITRNVNIFHFCSNQMPFPKIYQSQMCAETVDDCTHRTWVQIHHEIKVVRKIAFDSVFWYGSERDITWSMKSKKTGSRITLIAHLSFN